MKLPMPSFESIEQQLYSLGSLAKKPFEKAHESLRGAYQKDPTSVVGAIGLFSSLAVSVTGRAIYYTTQLLPAWYVSNYAIGAGMLSAAFATGGIWGKANEKYRSIEILKKEIDRLENLKKRIDYLESLNAEQSKTE